MIEIGGKRVPMREQEAEERKKNFLSVPYGYNEEEVIVEARRCIQCAGAPCETDCPINMKILDMIRAIAYGDFKKAFFIAKEDNPIPAITGRVCPQETQCEGMCPVSAKPRQSGGTATSQLPGVPRIWPVSSQSSRIAAASSRRGASGSASSVRRL